MSRLPPIPIESMSLEQRAVYDRITSGPRGQIGGPHWPWLRSPRLADVAQSFGRFCRFETKVEPSLIEIAILVTAAHWRAGLEWDLHAPVARKFGVSDAQIEAIRCGEAPSFEEAARRATYELCRQLIQDREVDASTYSNLVAEIGVEATVELIGILGYYALISLTIVAFEVPSISGGADPFAGFRKRPVESKDRT